jgi:uncharacterized membrane protein YgcG
MWPVTQALDTVCGDMPVWGFLASQPVLGPLLLLAQQLQGMTLQQRAAFLHSPAGGTVLRVLGEMDVKAAEGDVLVGSLFFYYPDRTTNNPEQQQAGQRTCCEDDLVPSLLTVDAVVHQLLVPGLLLQLKGPQEGSSPSAGTSSSTSSSSGGTSSSTSSSSSGGGTSSSSTSSSQGCEAAHQGRCHRTGDCMDSSAGVCTVARLSSGG